MKKHLNLDLNTLPEEGKTFSGELDATLFNFPDEKTHATGPMLYDLYVQKFDSELLIRGNLSVPIEFICVRTLTPFIQTIHAENLNISIEVTEGQINLADALREEIIILFPDYPQCDQGDEPTECKIDSRYLAVDKPPANDVKTPLLDEAPSPWDALDEIKDDADPPHQSSNPST